MIPKCCVLLLLAFTLLASATPEWEKFKAAHGLNHFKSSKEETYRKNLFLKMDDTIKKHNSANHSWKMKHSRFSIMTKNERKAMLGIEMPKEPANRDDYNYYEPDLSTDIPSSLDYRTHDCMAPIKDQLGCGSCWIFDAVNPLEFAHCKTHDNNLTVLSEQHIVDCVYGGPGGCAGGWPDEVYSFLLRTPSQGIASEASYPYIGQNGESCQNTDDRIAAKIQKYELIRADTTDEIAIKMKYALFEKGTLTAVVCVTDDFFSYGSGIYSNTTDCDKSVNHGVNVAGYGTTEDGQDFWIIRNSWSAGWGLNGYILMKRGINQCRIELCPSCVTMQ